MLDLCVYIVSIYNTVKYHAHFTHDSSTPINISGSSHFHGYHHYYLPYVFSALKLGFYQQHSKLGKQPEAGK